MLNGSISKASLWLTLFGLTLLQFGCKSTSEQKGRWRPYNEIAEMETNALRAQLKVSKREGQRQALLPGDTNFVWYVSEVTLYNNFGQPTLLQEKDETGKIIKEVRTDYRDSLLVMQSTTEDNGYSTRIQTAYDEKGFKTQELIFQRGDTSLKRTYQNDENGNETHVELLRYRGGLRFELNTERDAKGQPLNVSEKQNGHINWSEKYQLTDSLWVVERRDSIGKLQSHYEIRYTPDHRISSMTNKNPDGTPRIRVVYTYDPKGHLLDETFFGNKAQYNQKTEHRYDANGLLTETKVTAPGSPPLVTKYTYEFRK
jgi:hypothetical protein